MDEVISPRHCGTAVRASAAATTTPGKRNAYQKPMSANLAAQIPATPHQWASNS
ncbi:Uncharacterised protein [Mycobacteroides abscessus subsp. bolletii]|jgi:hypothetical protein|nr:Uncharacterised protein [Mycobacteroides abscessus subsp. bolletii]